jgi:transcriptional regulator with XRE-family HTH domain
MPINFPVRSYTGVIMIIILERIVSDYSVGNEQRRIRELRKSMKLTQSQFAELVNLSEDSIGKIERGVTIPKIMTLSKIAQGLKIPIEILISPLKEASSQQDKKLKNFISYLKTRSPEDIKFIHELSLKILGRKK